MMRRIALSPVKRDRYDRFMAVKLTQRAFPGLISAAFVPDTARFA